MKFKYSICYPDKEQIEFFDHIISAKEIFQLIEGFDWKTELLKETEFYSPSFDFIKLQDRKRIILSGIGDGKLLGFQIMYIEPRKDFENVVFKESNYQGTESYSYETDIAEGYELLNIFIKGEYTKLTQRMSKDLSIQANNDSSLSETIVVQDQSLKTKYYFATTSKEFKNRPLLEQYFFRVAGPLLILFFSLATFGVYSSSNGIDVGVIVCGSITLVFIVGTILFELDLRRK